MRSLKAQSMPRELSIDLETYSELDLTKVGSYVYAQHESTDVWNAAYAFDDEEPKLWRQGDPCPDEIIAHVIEGGPIRGWNVGGFERPMWRHVLGPKFGWPVPDDEQYVDTMVEALAMGLPGALANAAPALKLDVLKDAKGKRVMMQLCKPKIRAKRLPNGRLERFERATHPDKFKMLDAYVLQDVRTERAIKNRIVRLSPSEHRLWLLDQRLNQRGVYVNVDLVDAATKVVEEAAADLNAKMKFVTDYAVASTSALAQLRTWMASKGIPVNAYALDKDGIEQLLLREEIDKESELAEELLRGSLTDMQNWIAEWGDSPMLRVALALLIRQEGGKSSTKKLIAFKNRMSPDNRVRGTVQFNGAASTGRWAARGLQTQNFPRPNPKTNIDAALEDLMSGDRELIEIMHGPAMSIVADCLRPMICAAPGNILWDADLSQIEARVLAWLAGALKRLDRFRAYDNKTGPDAYVLAAAGIYGVNPEELSKANNAGDKEAKDKRQIGKVGELALGFQGGAGAFVSMAKTYRVDIAKAFDTIVAAATPENIERAEKSFKVRGQALGMGRKRYLAAELTKLAWRQNESEIVSFWKLLEGAALSALRQPGQTFSAGKFIKFRKTGSWLRCTLPSGRSIWYPFPRIAKKEAPWRDHNGEKVFLDAVQYMGVDRFTKKWDLQDAYGGLFAENVTQAVARDVLAEAMLRLEDCGYPPILTVHDEAVCETPEDFGDFDSFMRAFSEPPVWAAGLPLAGDGWRGPYYKK